MTLKTGIYEDLIYQAIERKLHTLPSDVTPLYLPIDAAEAPKMLTNYVSAIISQILGDDNFFDSIEEKVNFVNQTISFIEKKWNPDLNEDLITQKENFLSGIIENTGLTPLQVKEYNKLRPQTGFTSSSLFTGSNTGIDMQSELSLDILSADRIYWIVAFIRFTGVRILKDALLKFLAKPNAKLHIITTSYMAATEPKAVEWLKNLAPEMVDIKVNYDTSLDRLHAKAYIFERNSGLDTAYIGSSNISKSALGQGLEWNIRVTSKENPQIIKAARATFETYWHQQNFEDYDAEKFRGVIAEHGKPMSERSVTHPVFMVRPEQKEILDKLTVERTLHHSRRNLVVAATGTGKTVIAAFDYRRYCNDHKGRNRLLFIAHTKEILVQSRRTFASVLNDYDFGELWVGEYKPSRLGNLDHLFVSVQTFNTNKERFLSFGSDYYDYVIIDECHHIEANSYQTVLNTFNPDILLGLTATPERADGKSLLPDFNNRIAAEMRLPEAINRMLLAPFQYFCIGDQFTNLVNVDWKQGGYDEDELYKALNTDSRMHLITETLPKYLSNEHDCRALCFCIRKDHARSVAEGLRRAGYKADVLTGDDSKERRDEIQAKFRKREINYLCVVDIFNEGIDIPEIDTVLFLRPTKSLTIFLQQLGRGLRLAPDKECLTVLDYVAQANKNFSYESRLRALIGRSRRSMKDQVADGFAQLPRGCSINMDKLSRQYILDNIKNAIFNKKRLQMEVQNYRQNFDDGLCLKNFVKNFDLDVRTVYKVACWSKLKKMAGIIDYDDDQFTATYEQNMRKLVHWNDIRLIQFVEDLVTNNFEYEPTVANERYATLLYYDLYGKKLDTNVFCSVDEALCEFGRHKVFIDELLELLDYLTDRLNVATSPISEFGADYPLALFGCYSRVEQLILLGKMDATNIFNPQSGLFQINELNTELLWVTLNKSDKDFSPTTQYNDYAINETLFHWQSQNNVSPDRTGRRFVEQRVNGKKFVLFIRENKRDAYNFTEDYYCLGLVDFVSSVGERPMSITWRLHNPMPGFILDKAEKLAVG